MMTRPRQRGARAGLMLIVLGTLAILLAGMMFAAVSALPSLTSDPKIGPMLDDIRAKVGVEPSQLFNAYALLLGGYGVGAAVLGAVVRRAGRTATVVALVVVGIVTAVLALGVLAALAGGEAAGAIVPAAVLGVHAWLLSELIGLLRRPSSPVSPAAAAPAYQPMAAYYAAPLPPPPKAE